MEIMHRWANLGDLTCSFHSGVNFGDGELGYQERSPVRKIEPVP